MRPVPAPGMGETLRNARRARGQTQADLAQLADVGVRTVRELESGRTRRPHPESLVRIGRALGLPENQRNALVRAWTSNASMRTLAEVVGNGIDVDEILAESEITARALYPVTTIQHMQIGEDRRSRMLHVQRVLQARRDGIDHWWALWGNEPGHDLARVKIADAQGCTPGRTVVLPDQDVLAVDFTLPRPLHQGELHYQRFTWDFRGTFPGEAVMPTHEYQHGWRQSPGTSVTSVTFMGPTPSVCWEVAGPEPGAVVPVAEILPDNDRTVTICFQNPEPGVRGFTWEW